MPFNANDNIDNNDENKKAQSTDEAVSLAGSGGQGNASATGRVANFSTGQQPTSGSGRFTNLQKYIGANQGSGERLGSKIGASYGSKLEQDTSKIGGQNAQIAQNIQQGKTTLGEGEQFKGQLSNIGEGLSGFQSMENRQGFDEAGQAAKSFTQAPGFNRFQNIQSGQAIDNAGLTDLQNQAQLSGQGLNSFTQDRLNKINTEQGRYDLLKDAFGNKKNYSSGSARFDQLFLQNAPSNVVNTLGNQFNQGNISSNQLMGNIAQQGTDVNELLSNEQGLIGDINTQVQGNQDLFNTKLGSQGNIEFINKLRDEKYNEYLRQLQTGQIGEQVAGELGLNKLNTYQPGALVANPSQISGKITKPGEQFMPQGLRTYNTDLANTAASYLNKGRSALNMQDIATQEDFDAYNALAQISGKNTGKLAGVSTLDKSVTGKQNELGQSLLGTQLSDADKAFRDAYAGKTFQTMAYGQESGPGGGMSEIVRGGEGFNNLYTGQTNMANLTPEQANQLYGQFYNQQNALTSGDGSQEGSGRAQRGSGATAQSYANIDDYLRSGAIQGNSSKLYDRGGDTESNRAAAAKAQAGAQSATRSALEKVIGETGVRNQAQLVKDDPNLQALTRAKRFGSLV